MMTEKVKLPIEVAMAIEAFRNAEYSDYGIVRQGAIDCPINLSNAQETIRSWTFGDDGENANRLLDALRIGYVVELEFKSGDWVVNRDTGSIGRIDEIVGNDCLGEWFTTEGIRRCVMNVPTTAFRRHATPEEIKIVKERHVWAKIGREVGEFRVGDVRITFAGNALYVDSLEEAEDRHSRFGTKGFYPAESFISFKDDSND